MLVLSFRYQFLLQLQLDQVRHVHRHFINLSRVILFNIAQNSNIVVLKKMFSKVICARDAYSDKVDGNTLSSISTGSTDSVDVQLTIVRQIVVDDQRHLVTGVEKALLESVAYLWDVETTGPNVGGNENSSLSRSELAHDFVSFFLWHVSVHRRDREVRLAHLFGEPVDLSLRRAEDDGLGDGERVVQIAQRVELPLLALDGDEKLLDTFECQLITLDEDSDWVRHELVGHLEDLVRKSGRHQAHLRCWRQVSVHVVNLF